MKYFLGAYNSIRNRDINDCSSDLFYFLNKLHDINPCVFRWKLVASSRRKANLNPYIDIHNIDSIKELVLNGVNRRDYDKQPIVELGFRCVFWNGIVDEDKSASLSVTNGSFSPNSGNRVVMRFPEFGELGRNDPLVAALINAAVDTIEAERAVLHRDFDTDELVLDRAAYFRKSFRSPDQKKVAASAEKVIETANGHIFLKTV
ncbi:hypothetical protein GOZ78_09765 [Agrobacterium vitis]|uniref:Immunity protein 52 domain-containing protein n=1 Tax=Agrobacterium vitis TaxID=373 RepID=A0A6I4FI89_AGRVI|nr:Imm52 family immunity protein [Agrobacterium vitis]MUO78324.1 hypothetical protein [Agrobacterium vitis]MUO94201.1 hypothetical protein [Agrobacterium vitis]MUP03344.1 hypothetical protein [Agrobacterium vitis]MUZ84459.1 hypothetical protein [Agrobacterium vitis]MVA10317.1 hypothetical protein [Agrobacterium vitis]